jgi:hypothetical protein
MSEEETIWELRKSSEILGRLTYYGWKDFPWHGCHFEPTSNFTNYRQLFEEELQVLNTEGATDRWLDLYDKIEQLKLTLVPISGNALASNEVFIHIDGEEAYFKAIFEEADR